MKDYNPSIATKDWLDRKGVIREAEVINLIHTHHRSPAAHSIGAVYEHPGVGISSVEVAPAIAAEVGLNLTRGTLVVNVVPGSTAEAAGIRAGTQGDVIIGVDDLAVRKLIDILVYIERTRIPGDTVTLTIIRDGAQMPVELTLGVRPQG